MSGEGEPKQKTTYVVLSAVEVGSNSPGLGTTWREVARHEANGTEQAVRIYVDSRGEEGHESKRLSEAFVAVPERSFRPVTPVVERKPVTRLVPLAGVDQDAPETPEAELVEEAPEPEGAPA